MASLPYPLNWLYNHGRVGMAGMPYPPTMCKDNPELLLIIPCMNKLFDLYLLLKKLYL